MVRFAAEGGQGVVTASEALASIAAGVGYHVLTFSTFPSQVLGGPTWSQTRIATTPVLSAGDELQVLVALNREAYETHRGEIAENGVIIHDASFEVDAAHRSIGIPFDELAREAGDPRTSNMVMMGALAHLVNMPVRYLEDFIIRRYQSRGDALVQANKKAISLGGERAAGSRFEVGQLAAPQKPEYRQVLVKGNEALALGAMAAGIDVYIGYPITPATTVLLFMERNLVGPGKFVYQASSELEAINAVVGAGYAGKKAMTGTSGPGLSLMSEGIGLSWMAEIPLVVVNVQRGGPATGLPTKTEQSDLFSALTPAHGDVMLPIVAPGTVEECFYAVINAINWAERYQGPVVVLSDLSLAERTQNIPKPDLGKVAAESRRVYEGSDGFRRYESLELSPMPIPGNSGAYVANGSEHDAAGDTTHRSGWHVQMTERRFGKLQLLQDGTYESENTDEPVALMPWGGSKGPSLEAYRAVIAQGNRIGWYYTMQLHPLPPKLLEELKGKELVLVPELNYQGQFASYLRSHGIRAEAITQYSGLPFGTRDLADRIVEGMKARRVRSKVGLA